MGDLVERVGAALERTCGVGRDDRVLVAVSGGPDSIFLLHVLLTLARERCRKGELFAANLDHGIRGEESRLDSAFVAKTCNDWDVPLVTESADVEDVRENGESLEQAARRVRYEFLESTACMFEADYVTTGHTMDDQAETLLLRIERGTGIEGARGIMARRPISPGSNVFLARPILEVKRSEIMDYLRRNRILWRDDSSNEDTRYARNRIRAWLSELPEDLYSRLRAVICSLAGSASRDWPAVRDAALRVLEGASTRTQSGVDISISRLDIEPKALSTYVVREMIRMAAGDLRRITSVHAREVERLISGPSVGRADLPGGSSVVREYDTLRIGAVPEEPPTQIELDLPVPGEVSLPCGSVVGAEIVEENIEEGMRESAGDPLVEYADAGQLSGGLTVRFRNPGDRFRPLGAPGEKCIKAFFIDSKIPRSERDRVPIVVSGDRIVWVAGHRLDERFRIGPASSKAVRLSWHRP
jgi:tRNA(Ile)-lysidine synthase